MENRHFPILSSGESSFSQEKNTKKPCFSQKKNKNNRKSRVLRPSAMDAMAYDPVLDCLETERLTIMA